VTEKPKVANTLAYILGEGKVVRKNLNKVSYYELERDGKKIVVAPAVGHLFSLIEVKKSYNYPTFDIKWVPNYESSKTAYYTKNYVKLLEKLCIDADEFTSACDYDIEGSIIGGNIYKFIYLKSKGKSTKFDKKEKNSKVGRMKYSSLTSIDIKEAYVNKEGLDYGNINAGEARHTLDWYYGINLSRALMSALKRVGGFRIMSVGRVQGPALYLLAQLEEKIKSFVSKPYWELNIILDGIKFLHKKERFDNEEEATKSLANTGEQAKIEKVERKEQDMWALPPYDLTSLQIDAYRIFKFSPSRTLEIAQSLYENSLISYPRTASQKLPAKLGLKRILEKIKSMDEYKKEVGKIIENKWFKPMQGRKDDVAHPAIHPTGVNKKKSLDEEKLYDLIMRRFLACFAPKAKKELLKVIANSNGENYKTSGSRILEKGWIKFYGKYYIGKEVLLPSFEEGKDYLVEEKKKTKKETKPPRRYTAATVLSELEKHGLGTKATRATILDRLYSRNYIVGASIEVTDFGLTVSRILQKHAPTILDENLTRKIEEEMELIQEEKKDKNDVIKEGEKIISDVCEKWKKNEEIIGKELSSALKITENEQFVIGICDKCGGKLKIIKMKFGKQFIGCSNYPECKNAYPLPTGAFVKPTDKKCKKCGKPMVFVMKGRKRYSFCIDPNCPSKKDWKKNFSSYNKNKTVEVNDKNKSKIVSKEIVGNKSKKSKK